MGAVDYLPPFFLFNAHLETIYPALFRRVNISSYSRERITTCDNDFLDLDWLKGNSRKLVIIQHGLEGNSSRAYVKGMAKAFFDAGFDILAWNYRGCSEEMNRLLRFYHSGATEDLQCVIDHGAAHYDEVYLIGFSLGGNLTLKYLGEGQTNPKVKKAVVFSVPVELESSCRQISLPSNRIYSLRFLSSLKKKVSVKAATMPALDAKHLRRINTILDFDDIYTAPLHGFSNAIQYYARCSAVNFLDGIKVPALIVNTKNDPFLSDKCFPIHQLKSHPCVRLEIPARGGHVGFAQFNKSGIYWSEERALKWISE
ncbi:MAG TPA: alpha/beta fold hydrolase [Chryseosolibacter sp.]|nr:alpha/beta fold hydrolase [Chryseosolibacter sp.]